MKKILIFFISYNLFAAEDNFFSACKDGKINVVKRLIDGGIDVNAKDYWNSYDGSKCYAIEGLLSYDNLYLDIIKLLINSGANLNKVRLSPLHVASINGDLQKIGSLILAGADINILDIMDNTPLHWACLYGHLNVIEFLLNAGANIFLQNKRAFGNIFYLDIKPIDGAVRFVKNEQLLIDIVRVFRKYGFSLRNPGFFQSACWQMRYKLIIYIIARYPSVINDSDGNWTGLDALAFANSNCCGRDNWNWGPVVSVLVSRNIQDEYFPKKVIKSTKKWLNKYYSKFISSKELSLCQTIENIRQNIKISIRTGKFKYLSCLDFDKYLFSKKEIECLIIEQIRSRNYNEDLVIYLIRKINLKKELALINDEGNNLLSIALSSGRINLSLFLIYLNKNLLDNVNWCLCGDKIVNIYKMIQEKLNKVDVKA